jgi:hypothetical protein
LNGSGQETVTKNFLSDVRYIVFKWSWYDENNSVIYYYTLAPFVHDSLGSTPFGGNPLIRVGKTLGVNSQVVSPSEARERKIQRLMDEGRAWDKFQEWNNCAHPVWEDYKYARDRFLSQQRTGEVIAAIVSGAAALSGRPVGFLGPTGVIVSERNTVSNMDADYLRKVTKECGPQPAHP